MAKTRNKSTSNTTTRKRRSAAPKKTPSAKRQKQSNDTSAINQPLIELTESEASASASEAETEALPKDLTELRIYGRAYYKLLELAYKKQRKKRTSHIWKEGRGYEIIDVEEKTRKYYCCECLDVQQRLDYEPLVLDGNSSVLYH